MFGLESLAVKLVSLLLISSLVVGYFYYQRTRISGLEATNAALSTELSSTKRSLEKCLISNKVQLEGLTTLDKENKAKQAEISRYLQIFKKHDLTALARAKPGLIQKRVNKGIADILKEITNETTD